MGDSVIWFYQTRVDVISLTRSFLARSWYRTTTRLIKIISHCHPCDNLLIYARCLLDICCIRFRHGVIRWHTLAYAGISRDRKLLLGMFKNYVRIPTYGLYAKYTLNTLELEVRYSYPVEFAGHTLTYSGEDPGWRCTIQLAYWWRYHNVAYEKNVWVAYETRQLCRPRSPATRFRS